MAADVAFAAAIALGLQNEARLMDREEVTAHIHLQIAIYQFNQTSRNNQAQILQSELILINILASARCRP